MQVILLERVAKLRHGEIEVPYKRGVSPGSESAWGRAGRQRSRR